MAQPVSGILKVMRRDGGTYCHPATVPLQLDGLALITLPSLLAYPCSFPCFFRGLLHKPRWGGGEGSCSQHPHTLQCTCFFTGREEAFFTYFFYVDTF